MITIKVRSNYEGALRKYFSDGYDEPLAEIYTLPIGDYLVLTRKSRGAYARKIYLGSHGYNAVKCAEWGCHETFPMDKLTFVNE